MKTLGEILGSKESISPILRGAKAALTVEDANIILKQMFGPAVLRFAMAVYIRNGALYVKIKGSAAAAEIRMHQDKILAEICKKYGPDAVTSLRFIL